MTYHLHHHRPLPITHHHVIVVDLLIALVNISGDLTTAERLHLSLGAGIHPLTYLPTNLPIDV
jgi:hypothetical protein